VDGSHGPARSSNDELRVEGEEHAGHVRHGIRVRAGASDRPDVPDLWVADLAGRVRHDGAEVAQNVAVRHVVASGQGADRHVVPVISDVREIPEAPDVDQHRGASQTEPHEGQERVAAGDDLGVLVVRQDLDRLVHRLGARVVERSGDHA
jgi:hypothetical protein